MRPSLLALATLSLAAVSLAACGATPATTGGAGTGGGSDAAAAGDGSSADAAGDAGASAGATEVIIATSMGDITVALNADKAPITVANFLAYVDKGFYDGLLFHRVIDGFMVQGGGIKPTGAKKPTDAPIKNEADNGLKNLRGTIAMARTSVVDSATSQFFINVVDNAFLDHKDTSQKGYGYAVFGEVTAGMDVVDAIAKVKTSGKSGTMQDKPLEDVLITSIKRK